MRPLLDLVQTALWDARNMDDFYTYISTLGASTWWTIAVLVATSGYIMRQIVDSRALTAMFMLAFQGGAIFLNFIAYQYSVTPLSNPEENLIALSTVGMIVALVIALIVMRVAHFISRATQHKVERRP